MNKKLPSIFRINPTLQNYAWGGYSFIPSLIDYPNTDNNPCAELWMGDHPKSPSGIVGMEKIDNLRDLLIQEPSKYLGEKSVAKFGTRLPFLFKVLDVNEMLSIQSHPSKAQAEIGYAREERNKIGLHDFNRVFKDNNHKPELMVALSDFWLLHGFKSQDLIKKTLNEVAAFARLKEFAKKGNAFLYEYVMRMAASEADEILNTLHSDLQRIEKLDKNKPDFWALKAYEKYGNDRGIFSIYLFNLVHLNPGEAIFQDAGIPHAYLEGQNIEIMANSDNVFRGGLTPKHMDIDLLIDHTDTSSIDPDISEGMPTDFGKMYKAPVDDFNLYNVFEDGAKIQFKSASIFFVLKGSTKVNSSSKEILITRGGAIYISPNTSVELFGEYSGFLATSIL